MKKLKRILAFIITFSITVTSICSTASAEDITFSLKEYTYDANGNCLSTVNAEGVTTHFEYDSLNRMTATYTETKG